MTTRTDDRGRGAGSRWRGAAWASAAGLILLPLVGMQFSDEVNWGPADFGLAAALVLAVGVTFELAVRVSRSGAYRAAIAIALAAAFFMAWSNLAVGIIGNEENPANLMFWGVLALAAVGAAIARMQPAGLARSMVATAVAQVAAFAIALIAGFGFTGPITVLLCGLWLLSAWLFRKAAVEKISAAD